MQRAMSKQKKHFAGVWLELPTKKKLEAIAKSQDRSLAYTIKKILQEGVKHLGQ